MASLADKKDSDKNLRIQFRQISLYVELLEINGTNLPTNITKHIGDGIWELRPGKNRVLYFFFHDDTYVLLHYFVKKSRKTPKREIEKAKKERVDYITRKAKENENMG